MTVFHQVEVVMGTKLMVVDFALGQPSPPIGADLAN
jgi:hypothetical protein